MSTVLDRLADRAAADGRPVAEAVHHHLLEGILRRLGRLTHAAGFVLRGGMLTRLWAGPSLRRANDLDFVGTFPHGATEAADRFFAAADVPGVDDGLTFDPQGMRAAGIWLDTDFPGVRLRLRVGLGRPDRDVTIDVGFGDPLVPDPEPADYPTLLPGSPARVWCCRPETMVGWKLHGLAEKGPRKWRPKDLHDLDLITSKTTLQYPDIVQAIDAAFTSRGGVVAAAAVLLAGPDWWRSPAACAAWRQFRAESAGLPVPPDPAAVAADVLARLRPALAVFRDVG